MEEVVDRAESCLVKVLLVVVLEIGRSLFLPISLESKVTGNEQEETTPRVRRPLNANTVFESCTIQLISTFQHTQFIKFNYVNLLSVGDIDQQLTALFSG